MIKNKLILLLQFLKQQIPKMPLLCLIGFLFTVKVAVIVGIFHIFVEWKKSTKTKTIIVLILMITYPILTAIAFTTFASIVAWDKPYCVMVYNEEYHLRWAKVRSLAHKLYEERIDKALEGVNQPNVRGEIINKTKYATRDEAYEAVPLVSHYRPILNWTDLWIINLFNAEEGYYDGSMNTSYYGSFYAILSVDYNSKKKFYNWSHSMQSFRSDVHEGNWGYPRGTECSSEKYYLIKTLFN